MVVNIVFLLHFTVNHPRHSLSLEAGHSRSHDLIHQQKVGGNYGAAVDHLPLYSEQVI